MGMVLKSGEFSDQRLIRRAAEELAEMHRVRQCIRDVRSVLGSVSALTHVQPMQIGKLSRFVHQRGSNGRRRNANLFKMQNETKMYQNIYDSTFSEIFGHS